MSWDSTSSDLTTSRIPIKSAHPKVVRGSIQPQAIQQQHQLVLLKASKYIYKNSQLNVIFFLSAFKWQELFFIMFCWKYKLLFGQKLKYLQLLLLMNTFFNGWFTARKQNKSKIFAVFLASKWPIRKIMESDEFGKKTNF